MSDTTTSAGSDAAGPEPAGPQSAGSGSAPQSRYTAALAEQIELAWQHHWSEHGTFDADNVTGDLAGPRAEAEKFFVQDMFPYPSGKGLHVGHPLGYIATDVVARHQRMLGKNVLYPMGFDAFGLPAEQYAVQTGQHPRTTTDENIANMRRQLRRMGLSHDQRREFATTDPEFMKWTQWIFLQIFDSWFDADAVGRSGRRGAARPIADLVEDFRRGARPVVASDRAEEVAKAFGADPGAFPVWDELSVREQQSVLSTYRLAYLSHTPVNWCPGLGTVLANEEVTAEGRSERGNFPVFRSVLRQWNMRITAYGDRLTDDLDTVEWPESVRSMQRNWIGRSHGATVSFELDGDGADADRAGFEVFTTRVDTLFGATFAVLAPEHPLLEAGNADRATLPASWPAGTRDAWTGGHATPADAVTAYRNATAAKNEDERTADEDPRAKTGVFTGLFAVNPMDGRRLPVFTADYVLTGYGTGAIMAVPAEDERDFAFAQSYELDVVRTVAPPADFEGGAFTGDGEKINSATDGLDLNGMQIEQAQAAAIRFAAERGFGRPTTTYRLRDWLFSRQRYWGEPFPIVFDEDDVPIALPEEMLPVELPEVEDFSPKSFDPDDRDSTPQTPLSRNEEWATVELDLGDGPRVYRRETNTMPNWAGSSWYELRYTDPRNTERLSDPANEAYWMGPRTEGGAGGVDLYVGGVEHAVLHLLYARFWHKVLFDLGHVSSSEPFQRLFNQGYIQAYAYTDARGSYVPAEEVAQADDGTFTWNGEPVAQEYGKMGKSLKNIVTPDDLYRDYGADTFRVYEMSMGPLDMSKPWETRAVVGSHRFLQRVWRLAVDEDTGATLVTEAPLDDATRRVLHRTIDGVTSDMDGMRFNTVVAKLTELTNHLTKTGTTAREALEPLVLMLAPLAPHIAEELWQRLGHAESLARDPYPVADPEWMVAETVTCVVQVKGKVRHRLQVAPDIGEEELEKLVLSEEKVRSLIGDAALRKVIVRAPKLVNLVL